MIWPPHKPKSNKRADCGDSQEEYSGIHNSIEHIMLRKRYGCKVSTLHSFISFLAIIKYISLTENTMGKGHVARPEPDKS